MSARTTSDQSRLPEPTRPRPGELVRVCVAVQFGKTLWTLKDSGYVTETTPASLIFYAIEQLVAGYSNDLFGSQSDLPGASIRDELESGNNLKDHESALVLPVRGNS